MADLSRLDARTSQQDRITNNRDGVLPSRRNTEAPNLQVNGDLRNARRGEGGAAELLRVLGGVSKAAQAVGSVMQDRQEIKDKEEARADVDNASQDTLNGTFDAEKMAHSTAYRTWRIKGDVEARVAGVTTSIEDDIEKFTSSDEDGLWTTEDIDGIIKGHFKNLVTDENGQPRADYLDSPEARKIITDKLNDLRPKFLQQAHDFMVKQTRERDTNLAVAGLIGKTEPKGAYDLDGFMQGLPPQINKADALEAAMTGVLAHAEAHENVEGLQALLAGTKADGKTPLLGYRDAARLQSAIPQIEAQRERRIDKEQKDRYEANADNVYKMFDAGKPPSIATIRQLVAEDKLDPRTGRTFQNFIESDAREARSEARADRAEARANYRDTVEMNVAQKVISWSSGMGPMDPKQFGAEIDKLRKSGSIGEGAMGASNMLQLNNAWKAGRQLVASQPMVKTFATAIDKSFAAPKSGVAAAYGKGADPYAAAAAKQDYLDLVTTGKMNPAQAYAKVMKDHGKAVANQTPDLNAMEARLKALAAKR
jgi:hypothetical protein